MRRWVRPGLALSIVVSMTGCTPSDQEHLSKLGEKLGRQMRESLQATDQQLGTSLKNLPVDPFAPGQRAADRIRADKILAPLRLDVEVNGTQVVLRGRVPDSVYRQRAVELAESTVGVDRVTDTMTEGPIESGERK